MAEVVQDKPKVVLHWLSQSRSQRIVWLLQECKGIDWELKIYKRTSTSLAPPELKEVHPLGKSPVITIESPAISKPTVLAESGAIAEYLVDYFCQHLAPKRYQDGKEGQVGGESEQWLRYRTMMHYAEGSIMPMLLLAMIMDSIAEGPGTPFFIKPLTRAITRGVYSMFLSNALKEHFSFLEQQLATSPNNGKYLCGEALTAADILMVFPLSAAAQRNKYDRQKFPKLAAYTEMIENHEGYRASIKKVEDETGEPFKLLPG
ncbi:bifunctional glutathione transferase/peroxidase [Elasticomyces elasticus]|nr:bifunctional glutathione transferase/peroxidase [Elasticomyces elasticus]